MDGALSGSAGAEIIESKPTASEPRQTNLTSSEIHREWTTATMRRRTRCVSGSKTYWIKMSAYSGRSGYPSRSDCAFLSESEEGASFMGWLQMSRRNDERERRTERRCGTPKRGREASMKLSQPPLQHPPSPPCAGFFFCLFDASLYLFHSLFLFFHFLPLPPMDLGAQDIHFPRPGLSSLHSGASIRKRLAWAPSSTAPPRLRATHDELASVGAFATVVAHRAIGNRLCSLPRPRPASGPGANGSA